MYLSRRKVKVMKINNKFLKENEVIKNNVKRNLPNNVAPQEVAAYSDILIKLGGRNDLSDKDVLQAFISDIESESHTQHEDMQHEEDEMVNEITTRVLSELNPLLKRIDSVRDGFPCTPYLIEAEVTHMRPDKTGLDDKIATQVLSELEPLLKRVGSEKIKNSLMEMISNAGFTPILGQPEPGVLTKELLRDEPCHEDPLLAEEPVNWSLNEYMEAYEIKMNTLTKRMMRPPPFLILKRQQRKEKWMQLKYLQMRIQGNASPSVTTGLLSGLNILGYMDMRYLDPGGQHQEEPQASSTVPLPSPPLAPLLSRMVGPVSGESQHNTSTEANSYSGPKCDDSHCQ